MGRFSQKEFIQFLIISRGSIEECKYLLFLSKDLGYINEEKYILLNNKFNLVGKKLNALIKSIRNNNNQ
jgi:four helix bundle protein